MLTESEARTKRCCGPDGCGADVRQNGRVSERFCIGSACMAWRPEIGIHWKSSGLRVEMGVRFIVDDVENLPTGQGTCGLVPGASA